MAIKVKEFQDSLDYSIMRTANMMVFLFTGAYAQMMHPDFIPRSYDAQIVVALMYCYGFYRLARAAHKERKIEGKT